MENITSKGTIFGTMIAQAGPKGDTGKTGDRGLTGEAGYSPIKGVDYFTQEDISEIRKGIEGDLTGEYNKNAREKTNIFNTNAKETTTSFDLNAENKTKEYNDNALAEIEKYNSNAIEKSNNFDTNFENKTSKFDSNCDEKTKEFNDNNDLGIQNYNNNAKKQMEIFDTNFTEKLEAFNNNAGNKFNGFNTNSDKALAEYNKNHTAKMKEFDDNYDTKTKTFDDNAAAKLDEYNKNTKLKEKYFNDNAGTKTETFNSNAADKQNEFDENASDKLAEYNQNAKELINKVEQVQAENEALKVENKLIKEQIPSSTASGNSVYIEDSGTLDFEWKIKGGHKQATTTGKQMIYMKDNVQDVNNNCTSVNGVATTVALNNFGWANITFLPQQTLKMNQEYYFSADIRLKSGTATKMNYLQTKKVASKTVINNPVLSTTYQRYCFKITLSEEISTNTFETQIINGTNAVLEITNIMISTNSDYTYEKYTGEQPSPSPDYPSEIETVNGSVEIDVVNSNLLDFNVAQDSRVTVNEDGTLTINGTGGFGLNIDKLQLKAGITYYQKVELISGSISGSNINNTFLSFAGTGAWISSENFSQTNLAKDTEKTTIWINASAIFNNAVIKIWANIDKSDFVKHQSQTAIMPIQQEMLEGDYVADIEHHEWGKLVLTGNENWGWNTTKEITQVFQLDSNINMKNENGYCNCLKTGVAGDAEKISFSSKIFIAINKDRLSTVSANGFKEYLKQKYESGTPIIIYYKLAEPINLELTSEQKAVRDTKLYTYKNITNIILSDELASIDVNYKKDPTTEHDDLQNQIDEIKQLISTTETSTLLLDNLQKDIESEVE